MSRLVQPVGVADGSRAAVPGSRLVAAGPASTTPRAAPAVQVIDLADGARIIRTGPDRPRGSVLFYGRLSSVRDIAVRERLRALFEGLGFCFLLYESPFEVASRRVDPDYRLERYPSLLRKLGRTLGFLARPAAWRFLVPSIRDRAHQPAWCGPSVRAAFRALDRAPVVLAGRSHGARIMTLVADELGVAAVVALGYPFRAPDGPDDPSRRTHLATMRTPCLIVQGEHDIYGARDILGSTPLSPAVTLSFVPSDHGMRHLADETWQRIGATIGTFLAPLRPHEGRDCS